MLTLAFAAMLGVVRVAGAVEVDGIYEAQVPVNSQSSEDRTAAIRVALGQVMVKASGRSDAISIPDINDILDNATHYVQQYRYRMLPPAPNAGPDAPQPLALWVRFDPKAIDRLLRSHNLPVWGRARPVALLWLAIQQKGQRELLGADSQSPVRQLVVSEANLRGLPLRLPLLDLADQSNVSVTDVWGDFQDAVMKASQRYQPDGVLVGRVYQDANGQWNARWTLYEQNTSQTWENTGGALAQVVDPGIDRTTDILSQRFAEVANDNTKSSLLVKVDGVGTLAQYTRTVDYLSSLSPVSAVQPSALQAGSAIFRLTIRGDRLAVVQAIALGHTLVNEPAPQFDSDTPAVQSSAGPVPELAYRLLP